jgi:uncharacterized protein YuzE
MKLTTLSLIACGTAIAIFGTVRLLASCGTQPPPPTATRLLYALDEANNWGKISVYNIDSGHSLNRIISTVSGVTDTWGLVANANTGMMYAAYKTAANPGNLIAINLHTDAVVWNKVITPDIDRLAISPDGKTIYAPTSEDQNNNFINVIDASTGNTIRTVTFSNHSHDTLFPLAGPVFQETKASDGSGRYLYRIDPTTYAVTQGSQFHDFLGPYTVNSTSTFAACNVNGIWGFQMVNLSSGAIITATIPYSQVSFSLLHGIAFSPDETEVWQNTTGSDPHAYVWDVTNPMSPVMKQQLTLSNGGSHWMNFDIAGDYAYISPNSNAGNGTEVFNAKTKAPVTTIPSTEDELEIDFDANGNITAVGDQYGIGRK